MTHTTDSKVLKNIAYLGLATGLFAGLSLFIAQSLSSSVPNRSTPSVTVAQASTQP